MPRTKSAKKALRGSLRKRGLNLGRKKELGETIKKYKKMVSSGKSDEAKAFLSQVYKKIDKMMKVDFIKRGKANRLKSRLSKLKK